MDRAENHELLGDDKAAQEDDSLRFEPSVRTSNISLFSFEVSADPS